MAENHTPEQSLVEMERKLEVLIEQAHSLARENQTLRENEQRWLEDRARLIEKNDLARTRVEAMISRLKSLESQA
ncbi:TIGR02449 family protein [Sessilibacter corallicola]|uniref:TIGR02449 family protein n=1 Tax=Sessilibacter corallicola TaxID=2904075 RepID=A0ABQ0A8Q6_9GAMM|nr:TIGR02449 family protein [Sessilibacter corallicola]MCE2030485.1 TIGR02449 family protein [Sessilibacter corallicola]